MGQAGQRPGLSRRVTVTVFVAVVTTLLAALVAWACTAFLGEFEVRGDQGGTVKAIGDDTYDKQSGTATFGMNQTIEGSTTATSGTSAAPDAPGWIEIRTKNKGDDFLPPSDGTDPTGSKIGHYDVNYVDGPSYQEHEQWVVDCMTYFQERTLDEASGGETQGVTRKLGEVKIANQGKIVGAWDADGTPIDDEDDDGFWGEFSLPATSSPSGEGDVDLGVTQFGEASVCVSDDHGYYGNQAPITTL